LRELEKLAKQYSSLSTAQKNNWDRLRLPTDKIHELRARLSFHTSMAHNILHGQANRSIARIQSSSAVDQATLTRIEQAVQDLVTNLKQGGRSASVVSDEGWNFWTELRRELRDEGYPAVVVRQHRDAIKQYLLDILQTAGIEDVAIFDELNSLDSQDSIHDLSHGSQASPNTEPLFQTANYKTYVPIRILVATFVVFLVSNILDVLPLMSKTSSTCGFFTADMSPRNLESLRQTRFYEREVRAGNWANACYKINAMDPLSSCAMLPQQRLDFYNKTEQECPFSDSRICLDATDVITFDTGIVDTIEIGIKSTYKFRRKTTCTPVVMNGCVEDVTGSETNGTVYTYGKMFSENDAQHAIQNYTLRTWGDPANAPVGGYRAE
jgi:hypothetical protein